MQRNTIFSAFLLASVGLSGIAAPTVSFGAGVYKWVDEEGVVHYSDKKPVDQKSETLNVKIRNQVPPPPETEGNLNEQVERFEEQEEVRRIRKQQAQAEQEDNQLRTERCEALRENLKILNENSRVRAEGEEGELRYLTPEEIVSRKKEIQEQLDSECV